MPISLSKSTIFKSYIFDINGIIVYNILSMNRQVDLSEKAPQVGFAMVKPDGVELGISDDVRDRIVRAGLHIEKQKFSTLSPYHIDTIYADLTHRSFYPAMKDSMVGRQALSLLVLGKCDVCDQLMQIKGSVLDVSGSVRGDYSLAHSLPPELKQLYLNGKLTEDILLAEGFANVMRDDRMHCDESIREARRSIYAIFEQ